MMPWRHTRVQSRAPLRLGLAGGGTDIASYSDSHGGCVVNATIDMYVHCRIELRHDQKVRFSASDGRQAFEADAATPLALGRDLVLHKAVYRRIMQQFLRGQCLPLSVTTWCEVPAGSGLGSSSTLVVAMVQAYRQLLALPLDAYDVADLAYQIERVDVGQDGGRQDQYAATFGGVNFIEFAAARTTVHALDLPAPTLRRLQDTIVLFRTRRCRDSGAIIRAQAAGLQHGCATALGAMHELKHNALATRDLLLHDDLAGFNDTLSRGWAAKKRTAAAVSNEEIDGLCAIAQSAGASAGKVCGAGGGGFLFFTVPPERRAQLIATLAQHPGQVVPFNFTGAGAQAWRC